MKILLCYSRDHFDPNLSPEEHSTWGISANLLARQFYESLSELGDVTYSDGYDYEKHTGEEYDLFVGIERNFHKIIDVCNIKKSILIAVNMHPKERNLILNNFAQNQLRDNESIANGDLVDEKDIEKSVNAADFIFCFGNNTTLNSYLKNGVKRNKIKSFNYSIPEPMPKPRKTGKMKRMLYLASGIGLRKGFDIVIDMLESTNSKDFHLDIVGKPTNNYYQAKIDRLLKRYPRIITYHGYIPAKSAKYRKVLTSNDFLLFPSLEEGQAGTVIEGFHFGLVPLVSAEAGVDFSPLGFLKTSLDNSNNKSVLKQALDLSSSELDSLKLKTQDYYNRFHSGLKKQLQESINNCVTGHINPKVSVVLPIYNKESSILELLNLLDASLREYGNCDAHIIFDGCKDRSEEIVKKFYKKQSKSYPVQFYTTDNIFEVKTNNIGLFNSSGKYCIILQDDNYVYDRFFIFEAVQFLEKNNKVAILGGLAGVNFYPLGTINTGKGQIMNNSYESYWRQDQTTKPSYRHEIFEVDACMRGPLFIRKSFLKEHGYLDEIYAPLYQDDMDIAFRARKYGFQVWCMIMDVKNKSLTMANYSTEKAQYFAGIMERNASIFYERWQPSADKHYMSIERIPLYREQLK